MVSFMDAADSLVNRRELCIYYACRFSNYCLVHLSQKKSDFVFAVKQGLKGFIQEFREEEKAYFFLCSQAVGKVVTLFFLGFVVCV